MRCNSSIRWTALLIWSTESQVEMQLTSVSQSPHWIPGVDPVPVCKTPMTSYFLIPITIPAMILLLRRIIEAVHVERKSSPKVQHYQTRLRISFWQPNRFTWCIWNRSGSLWFGNANQVPFVATPLYFSGLLVIAVQRFGHVPHPCHCSNHIWTFHRFFHWIKTNYPYLPIVGDWSLWPSFLLSKPVKYNIFYCAVFRTYITSGRSSTPYL